MARAERHSITEHPIPGGIESARLAVTARLGNRARIERRIGCPARSLHALETIAPLSDGRWVPCPGDLTSSIAIRSARPYIRNVRDLACLAAAREGILPNTLKSGFVIRPSGSNGQ